MTSQAIFTLLHRRAWVERKLGELRRSGGGSRLAVLRLQALQLAVETRLRAAARRHAASAAA